MNDPRPGERDPRSGAISIRVREGGLEPPRPYGHWHLKPARLPFRHSRDCEPSLTATLRPPAHGWAPDALCGARRATGSARPIRSGGRAVLFFERVRVSVTTPGTSGQEEVSSMGVLQRFEQRLEGAVTGAFARAFRSAVQPVEIAAALQREVDNGAQILSRDRMLVPNDFTVELAPTDFERLAPYGGTLSGELSELVKEHVAEQHYTLAGPLKHRVRADQRPEHRPLPRPLTHLRRGHPRGRRPYDRHRRRRPRWSSRSTEYATPSSRPASSSAAATTRSSGSTTPASPASTRRSRVPRGQQRPRHHRRPRLDQRRRRRRSPGHPRGAVRRLRDPARQHPRHRPQPPRASRPAGRSYRTGRSRRGLACRLQSPRTRAARRTTVGPGPPR